MEPPYLRVGRDSLSGRCLVRRQAPSVRLSGLAVRTGIPFYQWHPTNLRIQRADEVGRPQAAAASPASDDLRLVPADGYDDAYRVKLARPVSAVAVWRGGSSRSAGRPACAWPARRWRRASLLTVNPSGCPWHTRTR